MVQVQIGYLNNWEKCNFVLGTEAAAASSGSFYSAGLSSCKCRVCAPFIALLQNYRQIAHICMIMQTRVYGSNKVWKQGAIPPKVDSGLSSIQIFKTVQFLVVPRLNLWFCFSIACKMFENRHTTRMQGSFVACNCSDRLFKIICNVAFDFPF